MIKYEVARAMAMAICDTVIVRTDSTYGQILHLALKGNSKTCCGQIWTRRTWFRRYKENTGCSACLDRVCMLIMGKEL